MAQTGKKTSEGQAAAGPDASAWLRGIVGAAAPAALVDRHPRGGRRARWCWRVGTALLRQPASRPRRAARRARGRVGDLLDAVGRDLRLARRSSSGVTRAEEVSPHLVNAIIATEDRRFYWHFGVDLQGTARAAAGQPARRRDGAGRLVDHPAGGEAGLLRQHPHARAQDQGDPGGAGARDGSSPRTRSCRSTSTAPISAPAPPASRRRPSATSASRRPR